MKKQLIYVQNTLNGLKKVSRYGDFDIDPQNYKNEDTYLDALTKRIKREV